MTQPYDEDLARIHDQGFGQLARNGAEALREELRRAGCIGGRIVDLGCGSGILAEIMAAAGFDVLGVDLSPAMIALARRRVPDGEFHVASLFDVDLPPCAAVAAVGEVLNYLFDERHSWPEIARLLARVHAALVPGGVLLLDIAEPERGGDVDRYQGHWEGEGWAVLVDAEKNRAERLLTRRITTFLRIGDHYRRHEETHRQRLLPRGEVVALLERTGFHVRALDRYGDFPLPLGLVGLVARKAL